MNLHVETFNCSPFLSTRLFVFFSGYYYDYTDNSWPNQGSLVNLINPSSVQDNNNVVWPFFFLTWLGKKSILLLSSLFLLWNFHLKKRRYHITWKNEFKKMQRQYLHFLLLFFHLFFLLLLVLLLLPFMIHDYYDDVKTRWLGWSVVIPWLKGTWTKKTSGDRT